MLKYTFNYNFISLFFLNLIFTFLSLSELQNARDKIRASGVILGVLFTFLGSWIAVKIGKKHIADGKPTYTQQLESKRAESILEGQEKSTISK